MPDTKTEREKSPELGEESRASQPSCECSPECCGWTSDRGRAESYIKQSEHWIERQAESPVGAVPVVRTKLSRQDVMGKVKARFGIGRMSYRVKPGLYAVGDPGPGSPVLVSANYKLSFDSLRCELAGLDAWILVLDTKGINVWCAGSKTPDFRGLSPIMSSSSRSSERPGSPPTRSPGALISKSSMGP